MPRRSRSAAHGPRATAAAAGAPVVAEDAGFHLPPTVRCAAATPVIPSRVFHKLVRRFRYEDDREARRHADIEQMRLELQAMDVDGRSAPLSASASRYGRDTSLLSSTRSRTPPPSASRRSLGGALVGSPVRESSLNRSAVRDSPSLFATPHGDWKSCRSTSVATGTGSVAAFGPTALPTSTLWTGERNGTLVARDARTGAPLTTISLPADERKGICCMEMPSIEELWVGLADGRIRIVDTEAARVVDEFHAHSSTVSALATSSSPDLGQVVMSASEDWSVAVWPWIPHATRPVEGRSARRPMARFNRQHSAAVRCIGAARSVPLVASGDAAGCLRLWDLSGQVKCDVATAAGNGTAGALSGQKLLGFESVPQARRADADSVDEEALFALPVQARHFPADLVAHRGGVYAICFTAGGESLSADGFETHVGPADSWIASRHGPVDGDNQGAMTADDVVYGLVDATKSATRAVQRAASQLRLVTCGADGAIRIWSARDGTMLKCSMDFAAAGPRTLLLDNVTSSVWIGHNDGTVRRADPLTFEAAESVRTHSTPRSPAGEGEPESLLYACPEKRRLQQRQHEFHITVDLHGHREVRGGPRAPGSHYHPAAVDEPTAASYTGGCPPVVSLGVAGNAGAARAFILDAGGSVVHVDVGGLMPPPLHPVQLGDGSSPTQQANGFWGGQAELPASEPHILPAGISAIRDPSVASAVTLPLGRTGSRLTYAAAMGHVPERPVYDLEPISPEHATQGGQQANTPGRQGSDPGRGMDNGVVTHQPLQNGVADSLCVSDKTDHHDTRHPDGAGVMLFDGASFASEGGQEQCHAAGDSAVVQRASGAVTPAVDADAFNETAALHTSAFQLGVNTAHRAASARRRRNSRSMTFRIDNGDHGATVTFFADDDAAAVAAGGGASSAFYGGGAAGAAAADVALRQQEAGRWDRELQLSNLLDGLRARAVESYRELIALRSQAARDEGRCRHYAAAAAAAPSRYWAIQMSGYQTAAAFVALQRQRRLGEQTATFMARTSAHRQARRVFCLWGAFIAQRRRYREGLAAADAIQKSRRRALAERYALLLCRAAELAERSNAVEAAVGFLAGGCRQAAQQAAYRRWAVFLHSRRADRSRRRVSAALGQAVRVSLAAAYYRRLELVAECRKNQARAALALRATIDGGGFQALRTAFCKWLAAPPVLRQSRAARAMGFVMLRRVLHAFARLAFDKWRRHPAEKAAKAAADDAEAARREDCIWSRLIEDGGLHDDDAAAQQRDTAARRLEQADARLALVGRQLHAEIAIHRLLRNEIHVETMTGVPRSAPLFSRVAALVATAAERISFGRDFPIMEATRRAVAASLGGPEGCVVDALRRLEIAGAGASIVNVIELHVSFAGVEVLLERLAAQHAACQDAELEAAVDTDVAGNAPPVASDGENGDSGVQAAKTSDYATPSQVSDRGLADRDAADTARVADGKRLEQLRSAARERLRPTISVQFVPDDHANRKILEAVLIRGSRILDAAKVPPPPAVLAAHAAAVAAATPAVPGSRGSPVPSRSGSIMKRRQTSAAQSPVRQGTASEPLRRATSGGRGSVLPLVSSISKQTAANSPRRYAPRGQGALGFRVASDVSPRGGGAVIETVDGAAALNAGLQPGDIITQLQKTYVTDPKVFALAAARVGASLRSGTTVSLQLRRGNETIAAAIVLK